MGSRYFELPFGHRPEVQRRLPVARIAQIVLENQVVEKRIVEKVRPALGMRLRRLKDIGRQISVGIAQCRQEVQAPPHKAVVLERGVIGKGLKV